MYLPFAITMTYGVGCFISMGLKKKMGDRWMGDTLVPIAAGFIIGEALTSGLTWLLWLSLWVCMAIASGGQVLMRMAGSDVTVQVGGAVWAILRHPAEAAAACLDGVGF